MNRWKTTESVTNEAEIIHFGGNVYAELRPPMAASLISSRACTRAGVPKHEVPRGRDNLMPILLQAVHTRAQREEGGGRGERGRCRPQDSSTLSVTRLAMYQFKPFCTWLTLTCVALNPGRRCTWKSAGQLWELCHWDTPQALGGELLPSALIPAILLPSWLKGKDTRTPTWTFSVWKETIEKQLRIHLFVFYSKIQGTPWISQVDYLRDKVNGLYRSYGMNIIVEGSLQ